MLVRAFIYIHSVYASSEGSGELLAGAITLHCAPIRCNYGCIFTFSRKPLMNLSNFATIHSLMNHTKFD